MLASCSSAQRSPAAASSEVALGRLSWGAASTTAGLQAMLEREPQSELAVATARVIKLGEETLGEPLLVVPEFQTEGILFSDARYKQSIAASRQLSDVYAWAMCARTARA